MPGGRLGGLSSSLIVDVLIGGLEVDMSKRLVVLISGLGVDMAKPAVCGMCLIFGLVACLVQRLVLEIGLGVVYRVRTWRSGFVLVA